MTPEAAQEFPEALHQVGDSIPDVLLGYQKKLIATTAVNQVTVVEKSRRIGVTWAIGADAVLASATSRAEGGMDTLYIGYNLDMAREFIDTAAMWAKAFNMAAGDIEETIFSDNSKDGDKDIKAFRITFASGFEIMALTSKPRSLRGRQGYVIFDEAAFHDDLNGMMKAAMAFLIWGGKVLVISTHDGDTNPFNELVNDIRAGRKPYALLRTDFDDAIDDGLHDRVKLILEAKGQPVPTLEAWRQQIIDFYGDDADEELFIIPSEGSGTYLPGALVEARMESDIPIVRWEQTSGYAMMADHLRQADCLDFCERELLPLLEKLDPNLRHCLGEDFGRSGDLTVMWPMAIGQDLVRRMPFLLELRNIPFQQQEQILYYILDRLPRFMAAAFDARGNGEYLAERAMQRYGSERIAQVMLTESWYRENMPPYKAAFEDAMITLGQDADVLADHRALVVIKGVAKLSDAAPKKGTDNKQRHGDSAIAGAMAWFASNMDVGEYDYIPVNENKDHKRDRPTGVGRARFSGKGAW